MGRPPQFRFIDTNLGLPHLAPIVPEGAGQTSFIGGNPLGGKEEGLPKPLPLVLFPYPWPQVPVVITATLAVRDTVAHLPSKCEHTRPCLFLRSSSNACCLGSKEPKDK